MTQQRCPYVTHISRGKQKGSVFCNKHLYAPENCEHCGWNPAEHDRRVALLRSGKVKTFLNIDMGKFIADTAKNYREEPPDDELEDEDG